MSNENRSSLITNLAFRKGLIIGGIIVALSLILWLIDPLMQYTNTMVSLIPLVLVIVLFVVFGLEIRKAVNGYWSFGEAFKALFIMSVCVSVLSILFHYILFNFIDPTLTQRVLEAVSAKITESLSNAGMSQDKIDEVTQSMGDKFNATPMSELRNLGVGIVIYAVIDLIIAASIKKNPPLAFITDDEQVVSDPTV
ncbi:MAG: DUF4199 domain-containing protein [Bacteroidota bacterium]